MHLSLPVAATALAAVTLTSQAQPPGSTERETIPGTLVSFEMVRVPKGTVTIDGKSIPVEPFYIGRTEVTWDMYDVFALGQDLPKDQPTDAVSRPSQPYGAPDYGWGHAGYAAISIARPAAQAFCSWLSKKTGKAYRLPTEAEWTHAAAVAVGSVPLTPDRRDNLAWHGGNALGKAHRIGTKQPDALGLFDLFGNAAEWVTTDDDTFVTRGGSFRDAAERVGPQARAIQDSSWNERDPQLPKSKWWLSDGPFVGFRIVRTGAPAPAARASGRREARRSRAREREQVGPREVVPESGWRATNQGRAQRGPAKKRLGVGPQAH